MAKKISACYIYEGNGTNMRTEDYKRISHLNIAFGLVHEDGHITADHMPVKEMLSTAKAANPDIKVLISINTGHPAAFSKNAETEAGRKRIADGCVKLIKDYGIDGIDMDWEYPCCPSNRIVSSPDDKVNFTLLCQAIREALEGIEANRYLFTIAAAGDKFYLPFVEMEKVEKYLDYVFLMTYDLRCGFHSLTGHHTNLYEATGDIFHSSSKNGVDAFHAAGVPMEKLVVGVAFYSRQWKEVPNLNNGFLQYVPGNGGYGPDYTAIMKDYLDKNGYKRFWDDECKAPYLYNGETFISYDDPQSVLEKYKYVEESGCAGLFAWEYNNDKTGDLLKAMNGEG